MSQLAIGSFVVAKYYKMKVINEDPFSLLIPRLAQRQSLGREGLMIWISSDLP